jgi:hypothetical protein
MTYEAPKSQSNEHSERTIQPRRALLEPRIEEQLSPVARALYRYFLRELGERNSVEISLSEEELFALLKEPLKETFQEASTVNGP